jgi:glycyl-tRNA synthetase beta chain
VAVALADKLDTLTGFWAIDEKPTGSKDPFALRRSALGVIRLVLENDAKLSMFGTLMARIADHLDYDENDFVVLNQIIELLNAGAEARSNEAELVALLSEQSQIAIKEKAAGMLESARAQSGKIASTLSSSKTKSIDLLTFFHDRLKVFLKDQGIRHDIIDACIAMPGNDDLTLLVKRAQALSATLKTDDGENLLQGFKRANNILTQAETKDGVEYSYGADIKFAEADAEKALFRALDAADELIKPAMEAQDFNAAMAAMASLRAPIDAFFTDVQVNADSEIIRRNRLNLLSRIRVICLSVADLSKIEG